MKTSTVKSAITNGKLHGLMTLFLQVGGY